MKPFLNSDGSRFTVNVLCKSKTDFSLCTVIFNIIVYHVSFEVIFYIIEYYVYFEVIFDVLVYCGSFEVIFDIKVG